MTAPTIKSGERDELRGASSTQNETWTRIFAAVYGVFLGLALLKFGNPVVLQKFLERPPEDFLAWLINSWPPIWGYCAMAAISAGGMLLAQRTAGIPKAMAALPMAWLVWELFAGTGTVDGTLTRWTLVHFASCTVCFYLGLLVLGRLGNIRPFFAGLLAGAAITVMLGFEQHFGGLEETRKYFLAYAPDPSRYPPEMISRIKSDRIFSTLFYPDTLAGAVLLLLPAALGVIWSMRRQLDFGARCLALALVGLPSLACLYWTGSKGGWLVALAVAVASCCFLRIGRRNKLALVLIILTAGLGGFALQHMVYLKKGAPSAVARIDFWKAAVKITADHPILGTGPGTFAKPYVKYMKPGGELPRMTHNDYLEQASDSGILGAVLYVVIVAGTLLWSMRHGRLGSDPVRLGVWLGALGWAMHSVIEFHLYIPAMAWPAFTFLGWLLAASSKASTTEPLPASIRVSG